MPLASGAYTRLYNWVADRNSSIKIMADKMDAEFDAVGTAISTAIMKDGQTTITADIPFNDKGITGLGSIDLSDIGFYTNTTGASVGSFPNRLMVGAATDHSAGFPGSGLPAWMAADWMVRDGQQATVHTYGLIAGTFASRSADYTGGLQQSTIAVSCYVVNDRSSGTARAVYAEAQHEATASAGASYGHEIVIKDKSGVSSVKTPYGGSSFGTFGIYLNAGGDSTYGGAATGNSGTVMWVTGTSNGTYQWNKGIVFDRYSLAGSDGTASGGSTAVAIQMAYGQGISWFSSNGSVEAGAIRSYGTSSANQTIEIQFRNNELTFGNNNSTYSFDILHVASGVNYLRATGAVTGSPAFLSAQGSDTDIDLLLTAKGTGVIKTASKFQSPQFNVAGAVSAAAWATAGIGLITTAATYTDTSSSGTVASTYVHNIAVPTLAASSSTTFTNAYTVNIAGPPAAGSNVTIGTAGALRVNGIAQFNGSINGASGSAVNGTVDFNHAFNGSTRINTGSSTSDVTLGGGSNLVVFGSAAKLVSYTVAGLPSASTAGAGATVYVSNESGGAVVAFSDATNWRRVTDRAIVS